MIGKTRPGKGLERVRACTYKQGDQNILTECAVEQRPGRGGLSGPITILIIVIIPLAVF